LVSKQPVGSGDVPALRKGLLVLEALAAGGPLTLSEVQRACALNKTMAFRLVRALREQGYVRHDEKTHRYALTLKLLTLGEAVGAQVDLVSAGKEQLDDLCSEFGETANLGVLQEGHVVYVAISESGRRGLRMSAVVGGRDALHSTSIGKAVLAFLPEPEREKQLAELLLPPVTPNTIVDAARFRAELMRTRDRGFAVDDEENELGARCVGVPVLDGHRQPIAAISLSGPVTRIHDGLVAVIGERLWLSSRAITQRLGYD
jgi:IclR family acetate operon transcriptional repressor